MVKKHKKFNRIFNNSARVLKGARANKTIGRINRLIAYGIPAKNFFSNKLKKINIKNLKQVNYIKNIKNKATK